MPALPSISLFARDSYQYPNYVHPDQTRGPAAAVVCGLLGVIATVVVIARFRSRIFLQRNPGVDDWVFLAATPFAATLIICICLATTKYRFDLHQWDIPTSMGPEMKMITLCICISYIISGCGIKVSVLFFYKRLTSGKLSLIYTWSVRIAIVTQSLYLLACLVTICTPCRPIAAYWLRASPEWVQSHDYHCISEGDALLSMGCISVVQDLIATLLPFHLISKLSLPRRQKIALYATFAGGLLVSAVGLLRVFAIWKTAHSLEDFSWYFYLYALASGAEVALAAICASLPALKYYLRAYLDPHHTANPNVVFFGSSELSDFTDYSSHGHPTSTRTGGVDHLKSSVSSASKPHLFSSLKSHLTYTETRALDHQYDSDDAVMVCEKPRLKRHVTAVENCDGEELVRSGILDQKALLYDSTHVRGRVEPLADEGGLMEDALDV